LISPDNQHLICRDTSPLQGYAGQLNREYQEKARKTDRDFGGVEEGRVGPVENKLLSFPTVQGMVFGSFGDASEAVHSLVEALATSRVRVAGPQRGRKGVVRTEEGEKSIAVSYIRRTLSLAQSHSVLGKLEGLGRGVTAAMGRRKEALELERVWLRERKATALSLRNGYNILRRGFAKLD
jgi:hypothetical protein